MTRVRGRRATPSPAGGDRAPEAADRYRRRAPQAPRRAARLRSGGSSPSATTGPGRGRSRGRRGRPPRSGRGCGECRGGRAPPPPARRPRTRSALRRSPGGSRGATRSRSPPAPRQGRRGRAPPGPTTSETSPCPSGAHRVRVLPRRAPDSPRTCLPVRRGGRRSDDSRDVSVTPRGSTGHARARPPPPFSGGPSGFGPDGSARLRTPLGPRSDRLRVSVSTRGLHEPSRPVRHLPRALPRPRREPGARDGARLRARRMARPARLRRGLDRGAPFRWLRDHRLPGDVHRRGGGADPAHPARDRGGLASLPPPLHDRGPDPAARLHDPGPRDVRGGPGGAHRGRGQDGGSRSRSSAAGWTRRSRSSFPSFAGRR